MSKLILISIFTIVFSLSSFAQQEKYTTTVNWERYKFGKREISLLLPKKPVFYETFNYCSNLETRNYAVFAEDVVYQIKIISKSKEQIPSNCIEKIKFGKEVFEERLKKIKVITDKLSEREFTQNKRKVIEIKAKSNTIWVFNDLENSQWIELSVTHRDEIKFDEKRFFESLEFGKNPKGDEIGEGAERILGDEISAEDNTNQSNSNDEKTYPLTIISKPVPRYTDAARQGNVQGRVTLRVTFMAHGGIGSISAVNGLPYGLTEQAIIAAKKLSFLPAKRNGKKYSVTKQVAYTFTIY